MNKYTISFNETGAWRKVMDFDSAQTPSIMETASALLHVTGKAKGRITAPAGDVVGYAEAPDYNWKPPRRAA